MYLFLTGSARESDRAIKFRATKAGHLFPELSNCRICHRRRQKTEVMTMTLVSMSLFGMMSNVMKGVLKTSKLSSSEPEFREMLKMHPAHDGCDTQGVFRC